MVKVITISVPEYTVKTQPHYIDIGRRVDKAIEAICPDGKYVYRAIGIDDHPQLTLDQLVDTILQSGTDKYDPQRKEVCFEEFSAYNHDIQAGSFEIKDSKIVILPSDTYPTLFGDTI